MQKVRPRKQNVLPKSHAPSLGKFPDKDGVRAGPLPTKETVHNLQNASPFENFIYTPGKPATLQVFWVLVVSSGEVGKGQRIQAKDCQLFLRVIWGKDERRKDLNICI